ncbi:MAG: response regulator [Oscillospiraceae bacterium]
MIWCVDDDDAIRDIEVYTLESTGFSARGFADGVSMLEALKTEKPDLIILDIMLPEKDGTEVLREMVQNPDWRKIPVIMATAKGTEMDKIQNLDLGADDYLVKPFGVMEMVSRVKAVLRRCGEQPDNDEILTAGNISLNTNQHTVTVDGKKIALTLKEFELLRLFMQKPQKVFTREELLSKIWGIEFAGESRTVDVHIATLRQKLGASGSMIKTVIGVGYRLEKQ